MYARLSRHCFALVACFLSFLTARPAAALTYSLVDLGVNPGPGGFSLGINQTAQIAGTSNVHDVNARAFLYANGQVTNLNFLSGGTTNVGVAINKGGQITGFADISTSQGAHYHAFLYNNGAVQDLGTLPGASDSYGDGLNDKGQVTGDCNFNAGSYHAFLYSNGVMKDLGTLGGPNSTGSGINNSGQIAGLADLNDGRTHAFLYTNGVMQDLGALPGSNLSEAFAINALGKITGDSTFPGGNTHAFLYANGAMTDIGTLPGGSNSVGYAINDAGQITGYSDTTSIGDPHAFLYSNGKMTDLNSLLSPADQRTWILESGEGINNRGQIACRAQKNGVERAVLMTPSTPTSLIRFDFNGDGSADILFQSQSNGSVPYETLKGVTPGSFGTLFQGVTGDYKVVATPDLNGDGKPDVIFQSPSTSKVVYALLNGLTPTGVYGYLFPNALPAGYLIAGAPDLNADGNPDIVLQNQASGDITYVFLTGVTPGASGYLLRRLDPNLKLVGTPDLNGDGHPDLLFQNTKTGDVVYVLLNGTSMLSATSYGTLFHGVALQYQIVGTPDLNADGFEDIVFQSNTTGDISYVLLNNLTVTGNGYLFHGVNLDFKIVGIH